MQLFHNCLAPNTIGDGTGCDNMTAIIIKFKPDLFELPAPQIAEANAEPQKMSRKRSCEGEAEPLQNSDKKQKIEDDLTPAAVDTSST